MPRKLVSIEPTLFSEMERIRRQEGVSVSQIVNEALAIALAERKRCLRIPLRITLPRTPPAGSRRPDRDEILSVLDF